MPFIEENRWMCIHFHPCWRGCWGFVLGSPSIFDWKAGFLRSRELYRTRGASRIRGSSAFHGYTPANGHLRSSGQMIYILPFPLFVPTVPHARITTNRWIKRNRWMEIHFRPWPARQNWSMKMLYQSLTYPVIQGEISGSREHCTSLCVKIEG